MTFRQFAFNNVMRNKRTYAGYFLSSTFAVMVFFVYAMFAFHPAFNKETIHSSVSLGLHFAEAIIYVFSFIFVLFSMSSFLKTRKKEFGLLVMHGMTNMQLRRMVFLENVIIGFFATILGIGLGIIFSKMLLLAAENILELEEPLLFYFPVKALALTFVSFLFLFVIISFATVVILKGSKLVDLMKGSSVPKAEPKGSLLLSLLAAVLLIGGYVAALLVKGLGVAVAMIPVTTVVIIGTYFLFTQLSVFVIRALKKRQSFFWKKTNLVLFSDLAYRMKDNARTFFFVAIVSTVAFTAIGSLVGFRSMVTTSLVEESPFAFEYVSGEENKSETEHVSFIRDELDQEGIPFQETKVVVKELLATGEEYDQSLSIVRESDYNNLIQSGEFELKKANLSGNEAMVVYPKRELNGSQRNVEKESHKTIVLKKNEVSLEQTTSQEAGIFPDYQDYIIVDDRLFEKLTKIENQKTFYAFYTKDWKETSEIGKKINSAIQPEGFEEPYQFFSLAATWSFINQAFGATLFIGLFIGAVFFVAAGSFLYFRLYTDLDEEKRKFAAIGKLGLTHKELSKIVTIQLGLLFFAPILVAVIHGAVALTALHNMFDFSLVKESTLVLGSFFVIQVIYFLFIRMGYIRKLKRAI
ncbi:ABC transporter permease [Siminovitchia sp. FSL H7-0308]|uniref:ABC transport system permease protein n=1 Tax=Siminovitchia thermophila TaxID=1245522 RepID=A0ABS2R6J4_9BACI|nr:ABC transporter permease [Siminovitchia thermophila]MBM7715282.1 putative ABC transport system permease protein [Siminovitchia thermophila]